MKIFSLVIGICLLSATGYGQALPVLEEVSVRERLSYQLKSWNSGDLKGFMEVYWNHDSLLFITANGVKKGWKSVFESYQKAYPTKEAMGELGFEYFQIRQITPLDAVVSGKWSVKKISEESKKEETKSGFFTLLFRKIDKQWFIISDHTN
jgi:uncharacterized protein (TIGR02246 family)